MIDSLLKFTAFIHRFQQVQRTIYVTGEDRNENDVEHSYQLAMTAWYLIDSLKLKLDLDMTIKYALAHDLVEIYAGDTFFYTQDAALKDSKVTREKQAAETIKQEFPEQPELFAIIAKYEEKSDPESKFIYALDKVLPVLNIYLDKGRSWKRDKVTYEMIRGKDEKIVKSPEMMPIWLEFTKILEQNLPYFHQNSV